MVIRASMRCRVAVHALVLAKSSMHLINVVHVMCKRTHQCTRLCASAVLSKRPENSLRERVFPSTA
eukprot:2471626-Amphidinium_carterae.1